VATPANVLSGKSATLSWSSTNATGCTASGGWSGSKSTSGSFTTAALTSSGAFVLSCTGLGGTASTSVSVGVTNSGAITGLNFPSNGDTTKDIRFRFKGANLLPMYPATYIWRVNLRQQSGYYTTFFWGPDGDFTGNNFYGAHPYPDGEPKPTSRAHKWELSIYASDFVNDANGHSTQLGYDVWKTQALRVWDDGTNKINEFYWDLPDTSKVIRVVLYSSYAANPISNAALTFGDAPWALGRERLSGLLRGIQIYSSTLSVNDIVAEVTQPMSTTSGAANVWYLNLNPTPDDISDKSGKGHHPTWVDPNSKASLWTGP
jgi:hypothetical protein